MSGLSSRVSMTHRCSVDRLGGSANSWGADVSYESHLTDLNCRGWFLSEQVVIQPGEIVAVTARHLAVPLGTDIVESDRIGDVTYRGSVIFDGPHVIDDIVTWPDRLELILRRAD